MRSAQRASKPTSTGELARLAALRRYDILDSPPDGAFDRVCALAARIFEVPIATVSVVDEDRIWFKARQGLDVVQIPRELGLCASAILHDAPYVVAHAATDPRTAGHSLVSGELGVRFYAAVPFTTSDGHRLGTLNVIDTQPRDVTEQEIRTLRDLAAIVTDELELRLAAMRQVQHERETRQHAVAQQRHAERLTQTLQRSLSPPALPDVPGLQVAVHYQPYSEEQVGGDFYDLFPLADGRWGFFLGDVCGKGPEAASVTSLARYTLRTAAMLDEDPAAILGDLNTALLMQPTDMLLCSAVYGEISPGTGEIELAVAGHPAPLIARATGVVEQVDARGTVLGAFSDVTFNGCAVTLRPGEAIILYSDGLLDTRLDDEHVDQDRLAQILSGAPATSAAALLDVLIDSLQRLDAPLRDDIAVMALSRPSSA